MQIFKKLFETLNKNEVKYLLCGGVAVNLYGIERATADVDLAVRLDKENLSSFVTVARMLGLKPKIPVPLEEIIEPERRKHWKTEKDMVVFSLYDENAPFFLLDVFIDEPFNFDDIYQRRKEVKLGDVIITLVPIDVLIEMKEKTGRLQDKADAFYLRKIAEEWKDDR